LEGISQLEGREISVAGPLNAKPPQHWQRHRGEHRSGTEEWSGRWVVSTIARVACRSKTEKGSSVQGIHESTTIYRLRRMFNQFISKAKIGKKTFNCVARAANGVFS